jgi:hypothetical protein
MFTWLNKQGVQSDDGFIVQFTGRYTAEYREKNKILTIKVEDGFNDGRPCVIIDDNAFERWDSELSPLPESERERLLNNFREACEFQGLKLVIERHK